MKIQKDNIILDKQYPFHISDSRLPAGHDMGKIYHWHECLEISYVKSGRGRYFIEDRVYLMEPGDVIILNNIEPHYLQVDEAIHQPVITFEPSLICPVNGQTLDYEYLKPFFDRGTDFNNKLDLKHPLASEIKLQLAAIEQEYFQKTDGYQLMIKARLLMIMTHLLRCFRDHSKAVTNTPRKRQCLSRMEEVLQYISENYNSDITLEELASKVYVTPQYFSAFFKKVTGKTFVDYLNTLRIKHAIRMLGETEHKITHIASECGFNSTVNFNMTFKKVTGKTPSEYRQ